jgi:phosphoribosylaminoimidazolecarboxamide formyltransferase/IMP cyclohydrolase
MTKYALLSVSQREGIEDFAAGLIKLGFTILTTSGTGKCLSAKGIESVSIRDYTGQPEILGGRVKTLHPKIHGGILARRRDPSHLEDLQEHEIPPIDLVAVNLYPFEAQLAKNPEASLAEMIEFIDIGGPTMIRAAAKSAEDVYAVIDPADYDRVLESLQGDVKDDKSVALRHELSAKVFRELAHYNLEIAKFLAREDGDDAARCTGSVWELAQQLRYGENPQQRAALYRSFGEGELSWQQLAGKALSYNNILDADAGYRLIRTLSWCQERFSAGEVVCILKHLTPCGAAVAATQAEALQRAKQSDPRSHFGGIIGFATEVTEEAAHEVVKDFTEIVIAPAFSDAALKVFEKRKNVRLLQCDYEAPLEEEVRSTLFGYLRQSPDLVSCDTASCHVAAGEGAFEDRRADMELAWALVGHTKSNAIVLVRDQMLIGSGAGQTSRIDSVEVALYKAREHGHALEGAVAASDAFFPFPDSVERLAECGVRAIIAPNGSKKDDEVVAVAENLGITLLFAPERHFRH